MVFTEEKQQLLDVLVEVRATLESQEHLDKLNLQGDGLCLVINSLLAAEQPQDESAPDDYIRRFSARVVAFVNLRRDYVRAWPHFSGDTVYPIPAPFGSDPDEYYHSNVYKYVGHSLEMRKSYLEYLIACLKQELEEQ